MELIVLADYVPRLAARLHRESLHLGAEQGVSRPASNAGAGRYVTRPAPDLPKVKVGRCVTFPAPTTGIGTAWECANNIYALPPR